MATVKLTGLFKVTAKGRTYWYAWRGGPRINAEYDTEDFVQEVLDARSPLSKFDRSKFATWVTLYKASDDYKKLAHSTRKNWDPKLDDIQAHFGKLSVRFFDRPQIRQDIKHWRDKWKATPRMADLAKQVLSRVCSFMVSEGVISVNPCAGISNLYSNDRSEIIWKQNDIDALLKFASKEVGYAARLASLTGMRQGDLLRLPWSRVGDLAIEIRTGKSRGRRASVIPIYPALRDLLNEIPKRSTAVLTNTFGTPWKSGFGASWNDAVTKAGLAERDLHFHDLRGTAATNFYRAGFTSQEIADILGWSRENVEELINRYVKRDELLLDRIRRMERLENENRKTDSKTGGAKWC